MSGYVVQRPSAVKKTANTATLFHVKHRSHRALAEESGLESEKVNALFTNAEIAKNLVEDILHIHPPGQTAKHLSCNA